MERVLPVLFGSQARYTNLKSEKLRQDIDRDHETSSQYNGASSSRPKLCYILSLGFNAILLVVLVLVLVVGSLRPSCNLVVERNSENRTSIGDLPNDYNPLRFNFHLPRSPYRGPPSPAVDNAWRQLTHDKLMIVPDSDLHGQNFSSRQPLRGKTEQYSGVLAKFEGFHGLHCVHLLWRHTWPGYYTKDRELLERDPNTHIHLDHCAELLRQMIQCNTDTTILTYYRKKGGDERDVFGDFNTLHHCRNFDSLEKYTEDHRWNDDFMGRLETG